MSLTAVVAPLVCCGGCGPSALDTSRVTGKVTIAGKEIPADAQAFVIFDPQDEVTKAESVTVPVVSSRYESSNVPVGKNKVYFDISRKTGPPKKSERTGVEYQDVVNLVPPQYSTGVELEVAGEEFSHDFDL